MALNVDYLEDKLKQAFRKGRKVQSSAGGVAGEVNLINGKAEVAGFIAEAITGYADAGEIMMSPGPFMFPNPAGGTPPTLPDLVNQFSLLKVQGALAGSNIIKQGFLASFRSQDPTLSVASAAIVAYASTFTLFQGQPIPNIAAGVTTMTVPPVFAPVVAAGLAGASEDSCATMMSLIIDASFRSCIFNGGGTTIVAGVGPIISQPLI